MRYPVLLLCLISFSGFAQKKLIPTPLAKKPLTHSVYDSWKEIPYKALTPDGNVAVFTVNPQDGDGKAVFHHLKKRFAGFGKTRG